MSWFDAPQAALLRGVSHPLWPAVSQKPSHIGSNQELVDAFSSAAGFDAVKMAVITTQIT